MARFARTETHSKWTSIGLRQVFSSLSLLLRPFPKPISKGQRILYRVQLVFSTSTFKSMMLFMGFIKHCFKSYVGQELVDLL